MISITIKNINKIHIIIIILDLDHIIKINKKNIKNILEVVVIKKTNNIKIKNINHTKKKIKNMRIILIIIKKAKKIILLYHFPLKVVDQTQRELFTVMEKIDQKTQVILNTKKIKR